MTQKIIHQVWVGSEPMPDQYGEWLAGWDRMHPEWDHILWTNMPDGFQHQSLYDQADDLFAEHGNQFRADLIRYNVLLEYGGVYVDLDMEPLRPLDDLVTGVDAFAGKESRHWINNAIIGCTPGHRWMRDILTGIPDSVANRPPRSRPNRVTGPQYITQVTKRHRVKVFEPHVFYPYRWDELDRRDENFAGSYAVHHWGNAHRRAGVPIG